MTIILERGGKDFVGHDMILVAADTDSTLATVYRMALVIALEELFWLRADFQRRAGACQRTWPGERVDQAVTELVRGTAPARPDARRDQRSA